MPVVKRPSKKFEKIAFNILGKPANIENKTPRKKEIKDIVATQTMQIM